jgi:hypothetical protein
MAYRITQKMLEGKADYLNKITGSPAEQWHKDRINGKYKANIGNYHISYAYGGASLHRMVSEGGGVSTPLGHGHVPKRELLNLMEAYIRGLWDSSPFSDEFSGGD